MKLSSPGEIVAAPASTMADRKTRLEIKIKSLFFIEAPLKHFA
jgi:hypothetical protein